MTTKLRILTNEKRELPMKGNLMSITAMAVMKKVAFATFSATLLMLVAAPARADVCHEAFPTVTGCGVTITISGAPGHLSAAIVVNANGAYDHVEDQLVGITNTSTAAVGAIVLSTSPAVGEPLFGFDGDGPCTVLGSSICTGTSGYGGPINTFVGINHPFNTTGKVLFTTPLAPNHVAASTTWFALENIPATVVAIGEAKTLTAGATTFPFGPVTGSGPFTENATVDDYVITPLTTLTGTDTMTVTAIPVPHSGVLGSWPNFSTLDCVPYADFSTAAGSSTCVEVERDCTGPDCSTFLYTATLDFNIDTSVGDIGGAAFLGQDSVACPTTGFNHNITTSYTGSSVGTSDPLRGGSKDGGSCYVAAFDPTAATVAPGVTVSTFFGFEFPVSNTKVNPILQPIPVLLNWDLHDNAGDPVTTLHLCNQPPSGTGCTAPWVNLTLTALTSSGNCPAIAAASSPLPSVPNLLVKGRPPLGLVNLGKGEYSFLWNTATNLKLKGCQVRVVLQFDNGGFQAPAVFQYVF